MGVKAGKAAGVQDFTYGVFAEVVGVAGSFADQVKGVAPAQNLDPFPGGNGIGSLEDEEAARGEIAGEAGKDKAGGNGEVLDDLREEDEVVLGGVRPRGGIGGAGEVVVEVLAGSGLEAGVEEAERIDQDAGEPLAEQESLVAGADVEDGSDGGREAANELEQSGEAVLMEPRVGRRFGVRARHETRMACLR